MFSTDKRVTPVVHDVTFDEVAAYSPFLADRPVSHLMTSPRWRRSFPTLSTCDFVHGCQQSVVNGVPKPSEVGHRRWVTLSTL
jgi:hypothetical protein